MKQNITRTKKYAFIGACTSFVWIWLLVMLLNHGPASQTPIVAQLEAIFNLSLLVLLVVFVRCVILVFQTRILLAAGEAGLYLQVSKKNRGIVPWRNIAGFTCSPDRRQVMVFLQGAWDVPDGCNERFDIQFDARGQRMIVLPLSRKVGDPARVCQELETWRQTYSSLNSAKPPDMDEGAVRRRAAAKKLGIGSVLGPLYFIRSKFWIFFIGGFLLLAALLETWTTLSRPAALAAAGLLSLLASLILRRLLSKAVSALENRSAQLRDRSIGL